MADATVCFLGRHFVLVTRVDYCHTSKTKHSKHEVAHGRGIGASKEPLQPPCLLTRGIVEVAVEPPLVESLVVERGGGMARVEVIGLESTCQRGPKAPRNTHPYIDGCHMAMCAVAAGRRRRAASMVPQLLLCEIEEECLGL